MEVARLDLETWYNDIKGNKITGLLIIRKVMTV